MGFCIHYDEIRGLNISMINGVNLAENECSCHLIEIVDQLKLRERLASPVEEGLKITITDIIFDLDNHLSPALIAHYLYDAAYILDCHEISLLSAMA